jgi:hypothetical protein
VAAWRGRECLRSRKNANVSSRQGPGAAGFALARRWNDEDAGKCLNEDRTIAIPALHHTFAHFFQALWAYAPDGEQIVHRLECAVGFGLQNFFGGGWADAWDLLQFGGLSCVYVDREGWRLFCCGCGCEGVEEQDCRLVRGGLAVVGVGVG